jgi:hypothetical protein
MSGSPPMSSTLLDRARDLLVAASRALDGLPHIECETRAQYRERLKAVQSILRKRDIAIRALGL